MRRDYVTNVVETRDTSPAVQRCRNAREARHRCIALPVIDGRYLVTVLAVCICTNGMYMYMYVHMYDARPGGVHMAIEK